jgi:hypothetical protein
MGGDLRHEFRELGKNLKELVHTAWKQDERQRIQGEIEEGLTELQTSLEHMVAEFRASPAGEKIQAQTKQLSEAARAGELELRVKDEFSGALRKMNIEIQRAIEALSLSDGDED